MTYMKAIHNVMETIKNPKRNFTGEAAIFTGEPLNLQKLKVFNQITIEFQKRFKQSAHNFVISIKNNKK